MTDDDEFFKKYEAHEQETTEDFLKKYSSTEREIRETIEYLIHHRELMRDVELERLEDQSKKLIEKLKRTKKKIILEEIECFKEILSLQKQLLQNDKP